MKLVELVAVPAGVVTETGPDVAPTGTVAVIDESEPTEYAAAVPLKLTAVAPVKPEPRSAIVVPAGPLLGTKDETLGCGGGLVPPQDGNLKEPIRVFQLSCRSERGRTS